MKKEKKNCFCENYIPFFYIWIIIMFKMRNFENWGQYFSSEDLAFSFKMVMESYA